jgi:hypothetical protein
MLAKVSSNVPSIIIPFSEKNFIHPYLSLRFGNIFLNVDVVFLLAEFRPAPAPLTDKLPRKCPPVTATAAFVHSKRSLSSLAVESGSRISHGLQQDRVLSKELEQQKSKDEETTTGKLVNNNPQRLYR